MSKPATHVLLKTILNGTTPSAVLYRASDGMRLANATDAVVQFGEDPRGEVGHMRVFLDHSFAVGFLRTLADRDWATTNGVDPQDKEFKVKAAEYAAVIEDRDTQRRVILAKDVAQAAVLKN